MLHRYGLIYTGLIGSLRFQLFEIKRGEEGHYSRFGKPCLRAIWCDEKSNKSKISENAERVTKEL